MKHRIAIPRELLLVEIERRCLDALCNTRVRIGLTKEEALAYRGFECPRCERTWENVLTQRDVPDWWDVLKSTGLDAIPVVAGDRRDKTSDVVSGPDEDFQPTRSKIAAGEDLI